MRIQDSAMMRILEEGIVMAADEQDLHAKVRTFEDVGMLTNDAGLVVEIAGMEFQITVVRSK